MNLHHSPQSLIKLSIYSMTMLSTMTFNGYILWHKLYFTSDNISNRIFSCYFLRPDLRKTKQKYTTKAQYLAEFTKQTQKLL